MRCFCSLVLIIVVISFSLNGSRGEKNFNFTTSADPVTILQKQVTQIGTPDNHVIDFIKSMRPQVIFSLLQNGSDVNSTCAESIVQVLADAIKRKPYALQVFDSWGKLPSGFLLGNIDWPGSYHQCLAIQNDSFRAQYFSLFYGAPPSPDTGGLPIGKTYGITVGSCFPDTCSVENVSSIFDHFLPKNSSNMTVSVSSTPNMELDSTGIIAIVICGIIMLIVLISTFYEQFLEAKSTMYKETSFYQFDGNGKEPSKIQKILCSFSIVKNTRTLLNTTERSGEIRSLHGLRFLSISWVVLGHSFIFAIGFLDNPETFFKFGFNSFPFQAIANGTFSVDSFFFIGGLLVAYLGFKEMHKSYGKINIPLMYLYRYVRLTPAYAFCILFTIALFPQLGDGPFWYGATQPMKETCIKYWWTNLLYINNLYPAGLYNECLAWSWYLGNDFQFFILTPFIMILLYRWPKIGAGVTGILIGASIIITGAFSAKSQQQPMVISLAYIFGGALHPEKHNSSLPPPSNLSPYIVDIYAKPWCRMGAYFVGMLTGYVLFTYKNIPMKKTVVLFGWIIAAAMNLSIVYGLYGPVHNGSIFSVSLAAFYNAMSRPCWCLGLAWLTIACVNNQAGPINALLSWSLFVPLSRLTYCIYLVHPLAIYYFTAVQEVKIHFSVQAILQLYLAVLTSSIGVAYILSMAVEAPVTSIMKVLLAPNPRPSEPLIAENETTEDEERDSYGNGPIVS